MSLARNQQHHDYTLCNQKLEVVNSHPYLGVHLQDDLGWNTHVGHAKSKASRMLGVVRRNLYGCPENLKKSAYVSLVRPHTEYASVAWDPHQTGHKKDLERVQRGAARFVKSDYSREKGTVTNLLKELDWPSLEERKKKARLILMYKITNNLVDIPSDRYLTPATGHSRHTNSQSFIQTRTRINVHKNSFFPRTIPEWNVLEESIVQAPSLETFKQAIQ